MPRIKYLVATENAFQSCGDATEKRTAVTGRMRSVAVRLNATVTAKSAVATGSVYPYLGLAMGLTTVKTDQTKRIAVSFLNSSYFQ